MGKKGQQQPSSAVFNADNSTEIKSQASLGELDRRALAVRGGQFDYISALPVAEGHIAPGIFRTLKLPHQVKIAVQGKKSILKNTIFEVFDLWPYAVFQQLHPRFLNQTTFLPMLYNYQLSLPKQGSELHNTLSCRKQKKKIQNQ